MELTYNEIAENAADVILQVLAVNHTGHGDAWRTRSDGKDVNHIIEHLRKHLMKDDSEEHVEHAITRLALMLARRKIAGETVEL